MNFFREVWNSEPLLRARLAVVETTDIEESDFEGHEDILASFMEDLGAAIRVGQVNTEHVWSYYSYYVDGYWLLLKPKITFYRAKTSDQSYFDGFESLFKLCARDSRKHGTFSHARIVLAMFQRRGEKSGAFFVGNGL